MGQPDRRDRQIEVLRERLSRLSRASLRINENLEVDAAIQRENEIRRNTDRLQSSLKQIASSEIASLHTRRRRDGARRLSHHAGTAADG